MLLNYLKVAFRYLSKHKGYTFINVLGLSVGIACCILIMLFVKSEWSFDRFHRKVDRIHRAWIQEHYQGEIFQNTVTPIPLGPVLQAGLSEAETTCRVGEIRPAIRHNNNTFNDPVAIVDSTFFKMFDFKIIEGDAGNPFASKNSIILTQTAAKKYFGNTSPVGQNLQIQLGIDTLLFTVSALMKNPPVESSLQFGMIIPFSNAKHIWSEQVRNSAWSNVSVQTFVLLKNAASIPSVHSKIDAIMNPLVAKNYKPGEYLIRLQPLHDIHFNTMLPDELAGASDPKYSVILATVGLFILLIACINFITLSIGRSSTRAMEVGVRKVLGAERRQLIKQFWGEAVVLSVLAMIAGLCLAWLLQKPFNQLANRELLLIFNAFTISFFIVLLLIIGLISGIYPALVLSDIKPIEVLKGKFKSGNNIGIFRKALIVGQFVASIVMIIGTFSIAQQLNYLRSKDLGYNKEYVVIVQTNKNIREGSKLAQIYKAEVQKNPQVIAASTSLYSMAEYGWMNMGYVDNNKVFRSFRFNAVDTDFIHMMNLKIISGRAFSKNNPADSNYVIVNEALVKEYGWKDPIGQRLPGSYDHRVLGVVKDFHIESLHMPITSAMLALKPDSIFTKSSDVSYATSPRPRISIRLRGGNLQDHISFLQSSWKTVAGNQDFQYSFLDDALNAAYEQEQRLGKIVQYASFLSIFIACMGLFGLATLVVVRRTKEIGIRKVLGADVSKIVALLSKEFIFLIIIAACVAFPIAWWALSTWLQDFAYRIDVPWMAFILSALLALFVALGTVSFQAIKAALRNPVKNLRTE